MVAWSLYIDLDLAQLMEGEPFESLFLSSPQGLIMKAGQITRDPEPAFTMILGVNRESQVHVPVQKRVRLRCISLGLLAVQRAGFC